MSGTGDFSDSSMTELFKMEVESHSAALTDGLLAIGSGSATPEILKSLMRAAHSIKGAARIVGLSAVVAVAHAMEDCFVAAQEGRIDNQEEHLEILLRGTDLLIRAGRDGALEDGPEIEETVKSLRGVLVSSGGSAEPDADVIEEQENPPGILNLPTGSNSIERHSSSEGHDLSNYSLLDLFRAEVESHASALVSGLDRLEKNLTDLEPLSELRRAAHSIKGAGRIVNVNLAVKVGFAMEETFSAILEGREHATLAKTAALRQGVELLACIARDASQPGLEGQGLDEKYGEQARVWFAVLAEADETDKLSAKAPAKVPALVAKPAAESSGARTAVKAINTPVKESSLSSGIRNAVLMATDSSIFSPENTKPSRTQVTRQNTGRAEGGARAVRVNAASLSRLMGLAGEALVEARWLAPFEKSLRNLMERQVQLTAGIEKLRENWQSRNGHASRVGMLFHELLQKSAEYEHELTERMHAFEAYALRTDNLTHRLYREVIASRMRPFGDGIQGFPRMVHDLVRSLGKKVRFEVAGKNTEVDRDILEKLEAPLNHLLRNAIDHGIEPPAERVAAGKSEQGKIVLEAVHKGGMLVVTVADDGRGVDLDRVRQKIVEKKLTTQEMAAKLTEAEVLEFLFLPGFSTASSVTEISGRGVGLDVVRNMIQEVSGQIRVTSQIGKGCRFHLQLPITLSVTSALLVEISGEPYAIPLVRIDRLVKVKRDRVQTLANHEYFQMDGQNIGLVPAQQVLELEEEPAYGDELTVVVVGNHADRYGLAVDAVLGEREIVVRPLDLRLGKVPNISAAALMEDGTPLLIVDVEDTIHSITNLLSRGRVQKVGASGAIQDGHRKRILIVDDSLTVREVERKLLENNGYDVEVATDGAEGWNAVRAGKFDLVISDVDMPRMNGIEFVTRMRGDARFKNLPVMIVSYKDREEDRLRGLEAGANYYLAKSSFHDESLLDAVSELIGSAP